METCEIIVNLWYVCDEEGVIYSLRAKPYVGVGSNEEKLQFLRERACVDYLIAEPFEIPSRFHTAIGAGRGAKRMPVAHVASLQMLDSPIALFEDAIRMIESRFPAQSGIQVPQNPLVCTTPLMQNARGIIEPRITGRMKT